MLHQQFDKLGDEVIQNITNIDIASLKSSVMSKNHTDDFNVDTVGFGIGNDGRGILCLVDEKCLGPASASVRSSTHNFS